MRTSIITPLAIIGVLSVIGGPLRAQDATLTGTAAYGDWTKDAPGVTRRIVPSDLAKPGADGPPGQNIWQLVPRPPDSVRYLYVGQTTQIVRYPYRSGDVRPSGPPETILSGITDGVHWTRDVLFSRDGKTLFVAVGYSTNIQEKGPENEVRKGNILAMKPDGSDLRIFAAGLRNPVSMAFDPRTNQLWASVNERDLLGDDLPPDYVTHVRDGGFYGWPYYYIGSNVDPRVHNGTPPVPADRVVVPDVLIQPHSAPLGIAFYTGRQFPVEYRGDLFVALHGSWNRALKTGYKIVRVKMRDGQATGEYEDFVTGFIGGPGADVWGRPVGLVVANDGSLLMSDDGSGTIWRIAYAP